MDPRSKRPGQGVMQLLGFLSCLRTALQVQGSNVGPLGHLIMNGGKTAVYRGIMFSEKIERKRL